MKRDDDKVYLKGLNYRKAIEVNCREVIPVDDYTLKVENLENEKYLSYLNKMRNNRSPKRRIGTVMHFDSDKNYLKRCEELYKSMNVYCYPFFSNEEELEKNICAIDCDFVPDVLVITGHDYFDGENLKDLNSYKNSLYFMKGILAAKKRFPECVIIAGACQSNFEALIANGANFASSPKRVNVHIYDPVIIAVCVCCTSFRKVINFGGLEKYIDSLRESFGGVETFGKMKMLY